MQPEILEIENELPDFTKKYCLFLKHPVDELTLQDHKNKETFTINPLLIWVEAYSGYLLGDSNSHLNKLIATELITQDIEFFSKMIDVTEHNKLVYNAKET